MSTDYKQSQRNTNSDEYKNRQNNDSKHQKEIDRLIAEGASDAQVIGNLKRKYSDNALVDKIYDGYKRLQQDILQKANKFKKKILTNYAPANLPFAELLRKAKKYAKNMSDDQFTLFVKLALEDKTNSLGVGNTIPNTKIGKTLGYSSMVTMTDKLSVPPNELNILQDILRLYGESKTLHSQLVLQTISYKDCAPEAINGELKPGNFATDSNNLYSYVHPVIAALFLPKIRVLDEHMLMANIGYIVKQKNDNQQIMTKPDLELYYDLVSDPNDHACNMDSALKDLYQRFILQTKLWDNVISLRQGKYYNNSMASFMLAIENCRSNIYDAPDLTYVKDEGTILRRLLSAFSLRPTIVSTTRLNGLVGAMPYGVHNNPLAAAGISDVTSVPMVTLRLPLNVSSAKQAISLEQSLTQPQWFIENKMIVPKTQSIIHSRDVLFFYVNRRFKTINVSRMNTPYNFNALPMTVAGWESLNDHVVTFEYIMNMMNDRYQLRSVVFVDSAPSKKNLIVGCSTGIIVPRSVEENRFEESFLVYDPQGSAEIFRNEQGAYQRINPVTYISKETPYNGNNVESFWQRATTRGTIFVYQKVEEGQNPLRAPAFN